MRALIRILLIAGAVLALLLLARAAAHAADPSTACGKPIEDFGDAPEGVAIPDYVYSGHYNVMGHFPSCLAPGANGTQESFCTPISTAPGATGYVRHLQSGAANYWLGCYQGSNGLYGIDSESDAKVWPLGGTTSACSPSVTLDGTGDEGFYGDDDAGLINEYRICGSSQITFTTANCGSARSAYLNVLVDVNQDGDWNDNIAAPANYWCAPPVGENGCLREWQIKNFLLQIPSGCATHSWSAVPPVAVPNIGYYWVRITLTDDPVNDDFPWAGSATMPNGYFNGGETEDYLLSFDSADPVKTSTWGSLKVFYR